MEIDWRDYVGKQLGEHRRIDFKAACKWAGADRAKLAADIIGFSNIEGGGTLVIGVREGAGKLLSVEGCSNEQLASFDKTDLVSFIAQHARPGAELAVEKPSEGGKTVVLLRVGEFAELPLVVTGVLQYSNGAGKTEVVARPGDVLIRTDAAQTTRVQTEHDMRELLRISLRKTQDQLLFRFRELLDAGSRAAPRQPEEHAEPSRHWMAMRTGWLLKQKSPTLPYIEFWCRSGNSLLAEFPDLDDVRRRVCDAEVRGPNWTFPGLEFANTALNVDDGVEWRLGIATIWFAARSGAFFYADDMLPALDDPRDAGKLYLWYPCATIVRSLQFAARYYGKLRNDVDLRVRFLLNGINGLRLSDNHQGFLPDVHHEETRGRAFVAMKEIVIDTTASKLAAGWEREAESAIARVLEVFNIDDARRRAERWVQTVPGARTR